MRVHYVLNHGTPISKLADVEIHFDEQPGLLFGLKIVGCSVWREKDDEQLKIFLPSRSYATAGGVRYYELLRASDETDQAAAKEQIRIFKQFIRDEFKKIPGDRPPHEDRLTKGGSWCIPQR